jgi:hypothetical protein
MENENLATELLREMKSQSKRWFVAFIVVVALWFTTIGAFLWYISLPVEEEFISIEQENDENGENQIIGGDYNG